MKSLLFCVACFLNAEMCLSHQGDIVVLSQSELEELKKSGEIQIGDVCLKIEVKEDQTEKKEQTEQEQKQELNFII